MYFNDLHFYVEEDISVVFYTQYSFRFTHIFTFSSDTHFLLLCVFVLDHLPVNISFYSFLECQIPVDKFSQFLIV